MFYISWALKNIMRDKKRSISFLSFLFLVCFGLLFLRGIFRGTETNMQMSLRAYYGDVSISSRLSSGLPFSMDYIYSQPFYHDIETMVKECTIPGVTVSGNMGFDTVNIIGIEGDYFAFIDDNIEWLDGSFKRPDKDFALLDYSVAKKLGLDIGDSFILELKTKDGMINTASLIVGGIFRGNKYIIGDKIYINLAEAHRLLMKNYLTGIKLYLKSKDDFIINSIETAFVPYDNAISLGIISRNPDSVGVFSSLFDFFHKFFSLFIWLFSLVFFLVLYFGVQNTVFIMFNERKEEVSTLMAFGMPRIKFFLITMWEMLFFMIFSFIPAYLFSLLVGKIISQFNVINISTEIVVVTGGPSLRLDLFKDDIVMLATFIAFILFVGTVLSIMRYLSREVVNMKRGLY